jgi:hypothetical protein
MTKIPGKSPSRTWALHGLMDLTLVKTTLLPIIITGIVIRIPSAIANSTIPEIILPGHTICGMLSPIDRQDGCTQFGSHSLIGINVENPLVGRQPGSKVLLSAEPFPLPLEKSDLGKTLADLPGPIRAPRVDNDDLIDEIEALQAAGDILFLVESYYGSGNAHIASRNPSLQKRQGGETPPCRNRSKTA